MENILLQIYFAVQKALYSQIDKETYDALVRDSKVLELDEKGIKVVETADQDIVKIFRLKRLFSSALFFSYAWRFKKNARQLKEKGVKTVKVKKIEYCLEEQRHLLTYEKIPGQTIKELLTKYDKHTELIKQLIGFIASLHSKGVYFRSLHFGNVVVCDNGEMALIDITDLKIYPWPLTLNYRIRNWKHLLKYSFETNIFASFGSEQFIDKYADDANLSQRQRERLKEALSDSFQQSIDR